MIFFCFCDEMLEIHCRKTADEFLYVAAFCLLRLIVFLFVLRVGSGAKTTWLGSGKHQGLA